MKFFQGQGKVREFCGWSGKFRKDLESHGKVRELKKNGYGRQSSENFFILFKGKKMYILMRLSKPNSLCIGGYSERKEFAPLGSKFFPLRVTPKSEVIQLTPLKYRIKMTFFLSVRGYVKM